MTPSYHRLAVSVSIDWKPITEGGKYHLPENGLYYVITEALPMGQSSACSWSLVLAILQTSITPNGARFSLAHAHFLMDNAPAALLEAGFNTNIYEGPHHVGQVAVL